jgi:hypothetical protein
MEEFVLTLSHWAGVVLVASGLCASQQASQTEKKQNKKVKVTLVVILASEGKEEVDRLLVQVAQEVRKKDPNLKRFRVARREWRSLAVDEQASFCLVDKQTAQVIVKRAADEYNRVELAIKAPGQVDFVYRSVCGKFLPITTNYQTKAKERLILAVCVQPCKK